MEMVMVLVLCAIAAVILAPVLFCCVLCAAARITELMAYSMTREGCLVLSLLALLCVDLGISCAISFSAPSALSAIGVLLRVITGTVLCAPIARGIAPKPRRPRCMNAIDFAHHRHIVGKVVIITGSNTGIGYAAAVAFVRLGAEVIIAARDPVKGRTAMEEINRCTDANRTHFIQLDLSRLADIPKFVKEFKARFERMDVLVNNAGGLQATANETTADGFEHAFAVMHLGHFLLTQQLLPMIELCHGAIINVSSEAHRLAKPQHLDDFVTPMSNAMMAYARGKLCNILFTAELRRRMQGRVRCYAVHPGCVYTGNMDWRQWFFARRLVPASLMTFAATALDRVAKAMYRTCEQGTADIVHCAASSMEGDGTRDVRDCYYVCCRPYPPSKLSRDPVAAARLWRASEEIGKRVFAGVNGQE